MDSRALRVQTEKKHIAYVNFIVEAYGGMAVIRTADPQAGLLEVLVSPDFESEFRKLASRIDQEVPFKIMETE